jgi:hypothetical protein
LMLALSLRFISSGDALAAKAAPFASHQPH